MKVISTDPHPSAIKQVVCKNCGSTLQYVPNDIKRKVETDYTGGKDISHFITCCVCNKDIHVSL